MIIGFCGLIGSGKTTAAAHLCTVYDFERRRFAGPMKEMMKALGLTDAEVDGSYKEKPCLLLGGKTPRYAMQTLGTEWGRELIHGDIWLDAWRHSLPEGRNIVCDDVRFANEAKSIRDMGGTIIRIDRPDAVISDHVSEAMPFTPDVVIRNDRTVVDLLQEINWLALNVWRLKQAA